MGAYEIQTTKKESLSAMKIFITDGFWRKSLAAVRSLGRRGAEVTVGDSCMLAPSFYSRFCSHRVVYPSPLVQPEEFLAYVLDSLKKTTYQCLMPMEEETLLLISRHKDKVSELTGLLIPEYEKLVFIRDKANMIHWALKAGIPCPKTYFVKRLDEIDGITAEADFPLVIKPRISSGSRGIRYVRCREELLGAYKAVHEKFSLPLIQEYVPAGGGAFCLSALFSKDSQLKAVFIHKRLREYPVTGGPSTFRESVYHDEIKTLGIKILKQLGWVGVASVEFKIDPRDNIPKLMEINPRFWGSLALSIYAGVDFPYLICRLLAGEDFKPVEEYKVGKKARWLLPGDMMHFFAMLKRGNIPDGFFNFFDRNTVYDYFALDDPLPVLGQILSLGTLFYENDVKRLLQKR